MTRHGVLPKRFERLKYIPRRLRSEWRRFELEWLSRTSRRFVVGDSMAVVSLTSYGKRIETVHLAIESIARGRERPMRLILWLDDPSSVREPTAALRRLIKRGLEVRLTPDWGPHKKYYPTLDIVLGSSATRLVTADDDSMYPRYWLRRLMEVSRENPDCIVGHRARVARFEGEVLAPWATWPLCRTTTPSLRNLSIGDAGVSYPRAVLEELVVRGTGFASVAPRADDVWLHSTAVLVGVKTMQASPKPLRQLVIPGTQAVGLARTNINLGANDVQIAATYQSDQIYMMQAEETR